MNDIFVDLSDGRKLFILLEIISGERLGRPASGQMRIHKLENVNRCLKFLINEGGLKIENISAEDIVDGNEKLILGLLWSIIRRFYIKDIQVYIPDVSIEDEIDGRELEQRNQQINKPESSMKEALVLWCQRRIKGYKHINVVDFTTSWRDGMAFNALIHSHCPKLIDYQSLNPTNHIANLNNAFNIAQKHLNIQPLLDAEDVDTDKPDEPSIITYVFSYYHIMHISDDQDMSLPRKQKEESIDDSPKEKVDDKLLVKEFELIESNYKETKSSNEESLINDKPKVDVDESLSVNFKFQTESLNEKPISELSVDEFEMIESVKFSSDDSSVGSDVQPKVVVIEPLGQSADKIQQNLSTNKTTDDEDDDCVEEPKVVGKSLILEKFETMNYQSSSKEQICGKQTTINNESLENGFENDCKPYLTKSSSNGDKNDEDKLSMIVPNLNKLVNENVLKQDNNNNNNNSNNNKNNCYFLWVVVIAVGYSIFQIFLNNDGSSWFFGSSKNGSSIDH